MPELIDDDEPKKTPRAAIIRRVLVGALALACAGGWLYTRYLVKKGSLGETCAYDMHCRSEAPRCLKPQAEGDGVCSRPCDTDGDCATGVKCVKVELDDRDERGRPLEGGYCFPQAILEARRKKPAREAGPPSDSWVDVPETAGQLEGELVLERAGARTTVLVKGTLLRSEGPAKHRTIVDTSTLRVYAVDDERKTFTASQLAAAPTELRVTKTERRDRVAERDCEIIEIEEESRERARSEACVVKGSAFVDPTVKALPAWQKELALRGLFPLRLTDTTPKPQGGPRLVAVKVDLRPLETSLFAIPRAYRNLAAR